MKIDQNTICLSPHNGLYTEYVLKSTESGNVLPGALVAIASTVDVQSDGVETAVIQSQLPSGVDIDDVEPMVVIENALLGKSINHKALKGEVTPLFRPISGDRLLVRVVAGAYVDGDPLYPIVTNNGIYLTKNSAASGAGSSICAYACENFTVPATTNTSATPPFYYDVVDDSTIERPSTTKMNGGVVNLLRVRFA